MLTVIRRGCVFIVDTEKLSACEFEMVMDAVKICIQQDCAWLLQDTDPLKVVDLLVEFGLMKKKKWWQLWL